MAPRRTNPRRRLRKLAFVVFCCVLLVARTTKALTNEERDFLVQIYNSTDPMVSFFNVKTFMDRCGQCIPDNDLLQILASVGFQEGLHVLSLSSVFKIMTKLKRRQYYSQDSENSNRLSEYANNRGVEVLSNFGINIDMRNIEKMLQDDEPADTMSQDLGLSMLSVHTPTLKMYEQKKRKYFEHQKKRDSGDCLVGGWWQMTYTVRLTNGEGTERAEGNAVSNGVAEAVVEEDDAFSWANVDFDVDEVTHEKLRNMIKSVGVTNASNVLNRKGLSLPPVKKEEIRFDDSLGMLFDSLGEKEKDKTPPSAEPAVQNPLNSRERKSRYKLLRHVRLADSIPKARAKPFNPLQLQLKHSGQSSANNRRKGHAHAPLKSAGEVVAGMAGLVPPGDFMKNAPAMVEAEHTNDPNAAAHAAASRPVSRSNDSGELFPSLYPASRAVEKLARWVL